LTNTSGEMGMTEIALSPLWQWRQGVVNNYDSLVSSTTLDDNTICYVLLVLWMT